MAVYLKGHTCCVACDSISKMSFSRLDFFKMSVILFLENNLEELEGFCKIKMNSPGKGKVQPRGSGSFLRD